jgi:hypothetical protein
MRIRIAWHPEKFQRSESQHGDRRFASAAAANEKSIGLRAASKLFLLSKLVPTHDLEKLGNISNSSLQFARIRPQT